MWYFGHFWGVCKFQGSLQKLFQGLCIIDPHPKGNLPANFERNRRDPLAHILWYSQTCSHAIAGYGERERERERAPRAGLTGSIGSKCDHCAYVAGKTHVCNHCRTSGWFVHFSYDAGDQYDFCPFGWPGSAISYFVNMATTKVHKKWSVDSEGSDGSEIWISIRIRPNHHSLWFIAF